MIDDSAIDVVMVGNTFAGKTTLLASMYAALQNKANGFVLRARVDGSESAGNRVHNQLIQWAEETSAGRFPNRTLAREKYEFVLQARDGRGYNFFWKDYRGGSVNELSEVMDTNHFHNDVGKADAVVLFADAKALQSDDSDAVASERICELLLRAVTSSEHRRAVILLLTKCDLVQRIEEQDLYPFSGLIDLIAERPDLEGAIVPVSCGRNARNVETPACFVVERFVRWAVEDRKQLISGLRDAAERFEDEYQNEGFFASVFRTIAQEPSGREKSIALLEAAQQQLELAQLLGADLSRLTGIMKGIVPMAPDRSLASYSRLINGAVSKRKAASQEWS